MRVSKARCARARGAVDVGALVRGPPPHGAGLGPNLRVSFQREASSDMVVRRDHWEVEMASW